MAEFQRGAPHTYYQFTQPVTWKESSLSGYTVSLFSQFPCQEIKIINSVMCRDIGPTTCCLIFDAHYYCNSWAPWEHRQVCALWKCQSQAPLFQPLDLIASRQPMNACAVLLSTFRKSSQGQSTDAAQRSLLSTGKTKEAGSQVQSLTKCCSLTPRLHGPLECITPAFF